MSSGKLEPEQIERVLRRAAQIDARAGDAAADSGQLSDAEIVRLGREAGLSADALSRALAEMKRGELAAAPADGFGATFGPGQLVVSRELPGPSAPIFRALERFMRDQLMVVRRHHGDRVEWEKARGLFPGLVRSLDFAERYSFGPVERVETLILPQGDARTSLTFFIDMAEARRQRLVAASLRGVGWLAAAGMLGSLLDDLVLTVIGAGFGVAAGVASWFAERRRFRALAAHVMVGPERFLDFLTLRRERALLRSAARPHDAGAEEKARHEERDDEKDDEDGDPAGA